MIRSNKWFRSLDFVKILFGDGKPRNMCVLLLLQRMSSCNAVCPCNKSLKCMRIVRCVKLFCPLKALYNIELSHTSRDCRYSAMLSYSHGQVVPIVIRFRSSHVRTSRNSSRSMWLHRDVSDRYTLIRLQNGEQIIYQSMLNYLHRIAINSKPYIAWLVDLMAFFCFVFPIESGCVD